MKKEKEVLKIPGYDPDDLDSRAVQIDAAEELKKTSSSEIEKTDETGGKKDPSSPIKKEREQPVFSAFPDVTKGGASSGESRTVLGRPRAERF